MIDKNRNTNSSIAVVGASALFPGSADSAPFWSNILAGKDFMEEVPADHWLIQDYADSDKSKIGKTYATRGAFIPKVAFDPMKYGMPPKQLSRTDTAQLLAVVMAEKVLEDAHSVQFGRVDKKDISVILGMASATEMVGQMVAKIQRPNWIKGLREAGIPESQVQKACDLIEATYPDWDESTFPGLLGNVVAGRVANRLDLGGTNCVIDAACASSLGAVTMAIQELEAGHSDLVITGGVDALNDIFMYMCFSKTPALSPTGDCRPFSDKADGTMLGEGLGMVALRRLEDAEQDGDRIYAVIRGMGSSSDGKAKSIYAPRAEGQELAIRRAYERAGYGSEDVDIVEAHGTATKAGDVAEFEGLKRAFAGNSRHDRQYCALGSVKSQIGHTKAAAGSASLFKMVMALHHKVLPPTIKVDRPNPEMEIEDSPFYLNTEVRPWIKAPASSRKASVSAFGFGGSNFHVALEEYVSETSAQDRFHNSPMELLLFAASGVNELEEHILACLDNLKQAQTVRGEGSAEALAGFAKSSQTGFDARLPRRLALLAKNDDDLFAVAKQALQQITKIPDQDFSFPNKMHYVTGTEPPKTAFVFPGQGSQYINMGAGLAIEFDAARKVWDSCAALQLDDELALHDVVFPIPVFSEEQRGSQAEELTRTHWAQPAIGATSVSMLRLLDTLGVKPEATAGHSYGEISALFAAGAITSLKDMISISRKRGELMTEAASIPGSMTAVMTGCTDLQTHLDAWNTGVCIANINSPGQVVIAGKTPDIEATEKHLDETGITFKRLPVATAFHSELVSPSAVPFQEYLSGVTFAAPSIPVYANTTASIYPNEPDEIRHTLAWQLANPVRFQEQIEAMYAKGIRLFLEVGPGAALTGMIRDCLGEKEYTAVALDNRTQDGRAAFWNALGVLSSQGQTMDFAALWSEFVKPADYSEQETGSPVTVAINGSNLGKPYPPTNGAAGIPAPNPELPDPAEPVIQYVDRPIVPGTTEAPVSSQPQAVSPPPPVAVTGIDANWTTAFTTLQQQTLEAQKSFQQTLSQSHNAFLQASETAFRQLGQLVGVSGQPDQASGSLPHLVPTGSAVPVSVPAPATAQATVQATVQAAAASLALPDPIPAASEQAVPNLVPLTPPPSVVEPDMHLSGEPDFEALLMEIVSDKTGYPVEMLELDMELEAGLGIDSIKRVEILSALQEQLPHLADVDTAQLAALNTLGEVLDFARGSAPTPVHVATPPASDSVPTVQSSEVDFEALLMEIVSDKTGYPVEMLELDMELEAGLGIDSIKRVEILSALQEQLPHLADVDTAQLAALNTLGEVLGFATGSGSDSDTKSLGQNQPVHTRSTPASDETTQEAASAVSADLEQLCVQVVAAPSPGIAMQGIRDAGMIHIVRDNTGVADCLAGRLTQAGLCTEVLAHAPVDTKAVILLSGLNHFESGDSEAYRTLNKQVFGEVRTFAATMQQEGGLMVTVQNTGGDFGMSGAAATGNIWSTGIAALTKTAAREWPKASLKAIDIATKNKSPEAIADAVFLELMAGGSEIEVGLMEGRRITLEAIPLVEAATSSTSRPLADGDVVVTTGGARGVTASCLHALATDTRLKIAILGRTPLVDESESLQACPEDAELKKALLAMSKKEGKKISPMELNREVTGILAAREVRGNLARLKALGAEVLYLPVDVTNQKSLVAALEKVRSELGAIKGLIHAAGVLADKQIHEKTDEQFDRVFDTKIVGFQNLLEATGNDALTHLVCFSSVAARTGNPGQVDYAMANEILNRVCQQEQQRRGDSCVVKSFGWGPWDGGMVNPTLKSHFASMGVSLIPREEGSRYFASAMANTEAGVGLIYGGKLDDWSPTRSNDSDFVDLWVHESTHAYIKSHTIRNEAVVPMMMVNEWCMRVAATLSGNRSTKRVVGTKNLKVLKGILLENFDTTGDWIRIRFQDAANPDEIDFVIEGADNTRHYQVTVSLGKEFSARPDNNGVDIDALSLWDWDVKDLYNERLFHGPEFRVIRELTGISDQACAGMLLANREEGLTEVASQHHSDVPILDGGIQLGLLWERHRSGDECLPTGFTHMELFGTKPYDGPVQCLLTCESATSLSTEWGLKFVDNSKATVAVVRGLKLHVLPASQAISGSQTGNQTTDLA